jgi:uncharacterized membrane protein
LSGPAATDARGAAVSTTAATAYRLEAVVARLLVVGTYVAIGLILVGVLLMLATGVDPLSFEQFPPFDLRAIPGQLVALQPAGFLWAGIVTVMALPIGRVVVSGAGFYAAGERRLALVSLLVLVVVAISIVAALEVTA